MLLSTIADSTKPEILKEENPGFCAEKCTIQVHEEDVYRFVLDNMTVS